MKLILSKAKHFWQDGESATWLKSDAFSDASFQELKRQYEELKYSKLKYIEYNDKVMFLFYRSKKDFQSRPITEISAFEISKNGISKEILYQHIQNNISNIFDNTLNYQLEIKSKKLWSIKKVFLLFCIFTALCLSLYFLLNTQWVIKEETSSIKTKSQETKTIPPEKVKIEPWKWDTFCKKYNKRKKETTYCYAVFIQNKCEKKDDFKMDYIEFVKKNSFCTNTLGEIQTNEEDKELKKKLDSDKKFEKKFFDKEDKK